MHMFAHFLRILDEASLDVCLEIGCLVPADDLRKVTQARLKTGDLRLQAEVTVLLDLYNMIW